MAIPKIFQLPHQTPFQLGVTVPGAKAYFFKASTTTPQSTYTTAALDTQHAHPVEADASGEFPVIYLNDDLAYRVQIKTAGDVLIYDQDNINDPNARAPFYDTTTAEDNAGITPTNYQYEPGNVLRYGTNTTPGTTDMLTAINNAVSVANQAGGGFVDITTPEVYSVSTGITWKSNVHFRICEGASIKLADGAADLIRLIDARGGLSNIGFYGPGRIDANAAGQTAGNRSHGLAIVATNVTIKDLEICNTDTSGGSLGDGVILEPTIPDDGTQCENVRIENCYIHDTGRVGITLESGLDVRITGCRIEDAGTSAIDLEPAGGTIGDIDGVIVSDCHVKNCSNGIHAVSETTPTSLKNIVFVNNILDNITDHGYQLRGCNNVSISGGRIIDPGTNGIYIFADNSTDADEIDIKDVHISGTPDYGVRAQRTGSGTFSRVSISGVTVDGSTVNSMLIEAVTELNLSGCKANYTTGDGFKVNLCTDAEVVGNTAVETAGIPASDGFRATNCTNLTLGSNTALGTDVGIALQSNTKIVWRGGDNFDEAATTFSNLGSNTGWYGRFAGSFTAANAVSTNVSSAFVETYSDVFFTPTNAAAGTLQAGANALYHNQAADFANTSFRVTTAAGGLAAGTETYNYLIVNENR